MTRIRGLAAAALVAFAGSVVAQEKKETKFDATKLVGTWTITAGTKDGAKAEVDKYKDAVEITKEKITLKTPDGNFEFSYKLDEKASPVEVAMEIVAPEMFKGTKATGIIKMDGDNLVLCYPAMGGDKPKDFEAKENSGHYCFTMKKAEKGLKLEPAKPGTVDK